jgi:acyl dehydratase
MATRELDSPPRLGTLYPKAVAGIGRSALRRLPGLGGDGRAFPDTRLVLRDVEIDRVHLAEYDRVCGFRLRDELPPTYPHVLAFPLSMQLMTNSDFPFPIIGLVHIRNRITQERPLRADERLEVRVWTEGPESHDKGTAFDVRAEASAGGAVAWRSSSTYLRREGGGGSGSGGKDRDSSQPPRRAAVWEVDGDTGRRYAAVSGDRNPIHLHPLSARLFGMSRPIAHGMWLKARCLAALEGSVPEACSVDVRFKLPVPLPSRVAFASRREDGGRSFALHSAKDGRPHLTGTVEPA